VKTWIYYLIVLALVILAAWLMPILYENPGHVEIVIFDWVLETTVAAMALGFLILFIALWFSAWLLESPRRLANRLARRGLENGLLALAEGDWKKAEKTLLRSARHLNSPAGYLAAARSAQGQDAERRREAYLEAADDGAKKTRLLIGLTRARVLINEERWLEAAQLLTELRARYGRRHDQVLRMLLLCYRTQDDWRGALTILPDLRKRKLIDETQAAQITALALEQAAEHGHSNLPSLWQSVPKNIQQQAPVLAAYARAAEHARHPEWALALVTKALKRDWQPSLVAAYGRLATSDAKKALVQCESWRKQHPEDAELERVMACLCRQQALWGKARDHYERSLALDPNPEAYRSLGDFLTERGENEAALICYRNALKMEQGGIPQVLPAGDANHNHGAPVPVATPSEPLLNAPKDYA
jgi:HemY protein